MDAYDCVPLDGLQAGGSKPNGLDWVMAAITTFPVGRLLQIEQFGPERDIIWA